MEFFSSRHCRIVVRTILRGLPELAVTVIVDGLDMVDAAMKRKDLLLAILVVIIWGVSFSVVKVGLEQLPPLLFVAIRFTVAAVPAVFVFPFPTTSIKNVIAVGVLIGIVKFGLLFVAMKGDASAGVSSLVVQAQVFFTIGLSYYFFQEKMSKQQVTGIVLAMLGFGCFFLSRDGGITASGLTLILGAAVAWALSNTIMKRMQGVNLLHLMIWASLVPMVPMFLASYLVETQDPIALLVSLSPTAWASVAYMAYLSTLVGYAIWGDLLKRYSATNVAPFGLLIPVLGIAVSSVFLGERVGVWEAVGGVAIFVGLCLCGVSRAPCRDDAAAK